MDAIPGSPQRATPSLDNHQDVPIHPLVTESQPWTLWKEAPALKLQATLHKLLKSAVLIK